LNRMRKAGVLLGSLSALITFASCIGPPITITAVTLPVAIEGTSYSQILRADTAGSWSITGGALPSGLELTTDGVLNGTPREAGTFNFTVTISSGGYQSRTGSESFTLEVTPELILAAALTIPQVGVTYSDAVIATGGTPPYTFSSIGLTAGLSLDSATGALSGIPLTPTAGVNVQFEVTDSGSPQQTDTVLVVLEINPAPIVFVTTALPNAQVGTAYDQVLDVDQGQGPFTFSVISGSLPTGSPDLAINQSTGRITGTPDVAGTSTFTIQLTDSEVPPNIATQEFTLIVE
jgi:hypothetical protein